MTTMVALTSAPAAAAGATPDENAAWQALKEGKALLVLRHALAPGFGDPESFQLENCSTQRNLSADGRINQAMPVLGKLNTKVARCKV